jgi:hypothetical protein
MGHGGNVDVRRGAMFGLSGREAMPIEFTVQGRPILGDFRCGMLGMTT